MRNSLVLFLATLFFNTSIFAQAEIDRGPYLQLSTPSSMTIKWRTKDPAASVVWYGSAVDNLDQIAQDTGTAEDHEIKLEGLNAATRYYYAVGDTTGILIGNNDSLYFETSPPAGTPVSFRAWVQGDPGTGGNAQRDTRDGFYNYLGEGTVDLMLVLGDNAYSDGKQSEFQDAFFEDMYEDIINKIVVWPTLGNHDASSASSADESGPYYDIFTLPKNAEAGGFPSGTEAYYSFDYSNVHFVVLNSVDVDRSDTSSMALWLEQDLQETNQDWIIAYFHHPIYSGAHNNESDDGNEEMEMRQNILPILEAHDVDVVFFGDTHNYQRSFLLKGHYGTSSTFDTLTMAVDYGTGRMSDDTPYEKLNADGGAVFVVNGSAGKLEGESEEDLQHPTTVLGMDEMGSCALEVNGDQLDCKFILQDGSVADHFTILKAINPLEVNITSPVDSTFFPDLQYINITADASDANGGVTSVAFLVNGELIHTDYDAPYSTSWHPLYAGSYKIRAIATDTDGFTRTSTVNIQVGQTATICSQVSQSSDDAEERPNGSINLTSSDLEMVRDGNNDQVVGIRFTGFNIPKGAAIVDAFLHFKVKDDSNVNPCQISISGQTGTNTTTFSEEQNNISSRPTTNTSINWTPPDWEDSGDNHSTPDIGAIIQEIVMQYNYTADQAIVLILDGIGNRTAYSFDKGDDFAPRLCITYDADNCLDADFDGTCDIDDICPDGSEPGQACNDWNSQTFDDVINNDCICEGTLYDCPDLYAQIGSVCNDGNPGTYNDVITADCNCMGTLYDCPDLQLQFGTPCNDNDVTTFDDLITTDCECEGTLFDCPDLQMQYGAPCDDNNAITCHDIVTEDCECVGTPTVSSETVVSSISANNDDAEEYDSGDVKLGSSDLEIITDGSNDQIIGLMFSNPGIAVNTDISNAFIQFTVDESKNENPCNLVIYGELSTNALPFANVDFNISTRSKTTASVNWSPNDWENVGDSGPDQQTTDLSTIIQELISQVGYTDSSPFVFIIEGEGKRVAVAHDKSSSDAAKLTITYAVGLGDSDGDGTCDDEDQCFGPEPGSNCDDGDPATYDDVVQNNCECHGTPFDCPDLAVNYGAACDDGNPGTFNDYVNNNCECVGSLFECPDLGANIGDPCDDNDPLSSNDQIDANCNCIGEPPVEVLVCDQINESSDDAEERSNGDVKLNSSDLELVEDNGDEQYVGLRFTGLDLQQNVVLNQVYLQFTVDKDNNIDPCILTIHGELSINANTFSSTENNISDRTMTNASVSWTPPEWEEKGDAGPAQRSPDISAIIEEIMNQEDFGPDSPIVLIINGEGLRQAISFNEDEEAAAELCMNLLVPPTSAMAIQTTAINNRGLNSVAATDEEEPSSALVKDAKATAIPLLKLFPNPAKSNITLSYHSFSAGTFMMSILDTKGKLCFKQILLSEQGMNQKEINTTNLPNGVYFLKLQCEKTRQIAKFSIVK